MNKRALIVEDDANIAELLRLYLGRDGFEVMIVSDGAKAENSFDLFTPDLVLLDIMLHHYADGERGDLRQGQRPGDGRGRLCDQAL